MNVEHAENSMRVMLDVIKNDKKFNMTNWNALDSEDAKEALSYKDKYGIDQAKYDQALTVAKCNTCACFAGHLALSSYMADRIKLSGIEENDYANGEYVLRLLDTKTSSILSNSSYVDLIVEYLEIGDDCACAITAMTTLESFSWAKLYNNSYRSKITPKDVIKALILLIKRNGELKCNDNITLVSDEEYNSYVATLDKPEEIKSEKPIKSIMDITARFLR